MSADDPSTRAFVTCDMGAVSSPDLGTVEALCRLRMSVVHMGYLLRLRDATPELEELLLLCGLGDASTLVAQRQPEEGKETFGVEEEVETGDPTV